MNKDIAEIKKYLQAAITDYSYDLVQEFYKINIEDVEKLEDEEKAEYCDQNGKVDPEWLLIGFGDQVNEIINNLDSMNLDYSMFSEAKDNWDILDKYLEYDEIQDPIYAVFYELIKKEYGIDLEHNKYE